ncbi:unnamed protein product [Symbiodinium sp. CCMP2592]|nr:unnamed protein product [Symbiodinium sp. CCMP2592]
MLQFDGMDQAKWSLPRYPENRGSKTLQQYVRPRLKVVGVWASKYLLTLYLVDANIAHDASLTVEVYDLSQASAAHMRTELQDDSLMTMKTNCSKIYSVTQNRLMNVEEIFSTLCVPTKTQFVT